MRKISLLLAAAALFTVSLPARAAGPPGRVRVELRDLIPEGLAWDPEDGVFYLSSIHRRSVYRVTPDGAVNDLGPAGAPDAFPMLGMKVDAERRQLWVCSTDFNEGPNQGRTAIYLYDLRTGRVAQRFAPPGDARGPMVNDLVVTKDGRVFATDSNAGSLQTIRGTTLVPSLPAGTFTQPNGIALAPDERVLFVADGSGVHRAALDAGGPALPSRLPTPAGAASVAGIDGLYAVDGALVGIQNGFPGRERIVRLRLSATSDSITGIDTLLAEHPLWNVPTTGTFVGADFWYLANSQLDRIDAAGRLAPPESLDATEIVRLIPPLGLPGSTPPTTPLRVFLLGDAGEPHPGREPVLEALRAEIARDPARSLVVVLGDNIYPKGLPDSTDASRAEMERRLIDQVLALRGAALGTWIIPGNHDWDRSGPDGWAAIQRQQRLVERLAAAGGPPLRFLPRGGCPGPVVVDLEDRLRLVALDTQWWLHDQVKPLDPTSNCPEDSPEEVARALELALAGGGTRSVIVAGHHPLVSHGPHGGHFPLIDHLFPLRALNENLWLPVPLLGSIYPLARRAAAPPQDLGGDAYERMRAALEGAMAKDPPLLYASGHDHTLQVLAGRGARNNVVSGAGIYGHGERVAWKSDTRYASSQAGFMRLDLKEDGSGRLVVFTAGEDGRAREAWSGPLR